MHQWPPHIHEKDYPEQSFHAHGFEEQIVLVVPSHDVVVVRLGCTNELYEWRRGILYRDIVDTIPPV